jgi:hypothetical protein
MKPVTVPPKIRAALDGINQAVSNLSDLVYQRGVTNGTTTATCLGCPGPLLPGVA